MAAAAPRPASGGPGTGKERPAPQGGCAHPPSGQPGEKDLSGKHLQTLPTQTPPFFFLLGPSGLGLVSQGSLRVQGGVSRRTGPGSSSLAFLRIAASSKGSAPSQLFRLQQRTRDPGPADHGTRTPQTQSLAHQTSLSYLDLGVCHLQPEGPRTILASVAGLSLQGARDHLAWCLPLLCPSLAFSDPIQGLWPPSPRLLKPLTPRPLPRLPPASMGKANSSALPSWPDFLHTCLPLGLSCPQAPRRNCPSAGPCPWLTKRAGIGGLNTSGSRTFLCIRII